MDHSLPRGHPWNIHPGINTWGGTGQGKWPWNIKLDGPQAAGARWHELNSPQHTRRWGLREDAVALGLGVADGVIVSDAVEVPVDVRMAVDEGVGVGVAVALCWTSNNGAFSIVLAFESWWTEMAVVQHSTGHDTPNPALVSVAGCTRLAPHKVV